jgi:hypothetical protein
MGVVVDADGLFLVQVRMCVVCLIVVEGCR